MLKTLILAGLATFIATPARTEIFVQPIAAGTSVTSVRPSVQYCGNFFIKNSGGSWSIVPKTEANLKNNNFEKLKGCLGKTEDGPVNSIVFSVATQSTCATYSVCAPTMNGNGSCIMTENYKHKASRDDGYYSCNSGFANRKGFFNALQFDSPIDEALLTSALSSDSIKAASNEFAQSEYRRVIADAVLSDANACGTCRPEEYAINDLFNFFANNATADELYVAGKNYITITGVRQLPTHIGSHLSPAAAAMLIAEGEQAWHRKYSAQVEQLTAPNAKINDIKSFINRLERPAGNNWADVDFEARLPQLKDLLNKLLTKVAMDAEIERQAEVNRILAWRKNLRVGLDTFCGRVIAVNQSMIKIAVRAQLPGFSNEAWLESSEVFPPQYGCRNKNGRLSAY